MLRFVVCGIMLAAFIAGIGHMLNGLSRSMHVWSFMVVCGALCVVGLALAFGWDWIARRGDAEPTRT